MTVSAMHEIVDTAARDVLETMFFTLVEDEGNENVGHQLDEGTDPVGTAVAATVRFTGDRAGALALALTAGAARDIAGNFLGLEAGEIGEPEVSSVVCELANMICGAAVSRLDQGGDFILSAPEPGWGETHPVALELPLAGGLGALRLAFHMDTEAA